MGRVIIIGGGFGGISAAKALAKSKHEIILIDKTNHHLFQPLLYQVATAALSPGDMASPIRSILRKQKNTSVLMGEVLKIDKEKKTVHLKDRSLVYDYLIVSVGSRHSYFGNPEWEKYAPGLKTLNDAFSIRDRILLSFERAESSPDKDEKRKLLTFVIVGGGPTGVEIAGAIAEISRRAMKNDFRNIDTSKTKIILLEAQNRILSMYDNKLSGMAKSYLESIGVNVLLNTRVTQINDRGIIIDKDTIETPNVIWAAGNKIPSLVKSLNADTDNTGRVITNPDCSVPRHPEVFVIGDAALFLQNGAALPAVAPVAIQQGKYVGNLIALCTETDKRKPFRYFNKGNLATIGRGRAIMQIGNFTVSGFTAWCAWVFIHILYLIEFRNRYKVLAEWTWYYLTYRSGVRLITGEYEKDKRNDSV